MPNEPQETTQDETHDAVHDAKTGEGWIRETTVSGDDVPGIDRHHRRELTKRLRQKWSYIDSIQIERKSGRTWVSTGAGLVMPEGRNGVSPEGGAEEAVAMARTVWETYQGRHQIRVAVMGHSQSGSTAKMLFTVLTDFNDLDDEAETDADPSLSRERSRREKDVENIAAMDAMRQAMTNAMDHWNTAIGKVERMADKVVELVDQSSKNWSGMVEMMRLQNEARKEEREYQAAAAEDERNAARFDMFAEQAIGIATRIAEDFIRSKVGSKVVDGSYSERLRAILETLDEENRKKAREMVGEEPWQILEDAAKGVPNEAFTQLMHKAANAMEGDPQKTMMRIFPLLGTDVSQALMILLNEASKG